MFKIILSATNEEKREKGLMFSDPLKEDECALFIFPRTADHAFWNKNVSYPLSLVFCNSNNEVISIKNMEAESTKSCRSNNSNVKYVIELKKGVVDDVKEGDSLVIENGEKLYFSKK